MNLKHFKAQIRLVTDFLEEECDLFIPGLKKKVLKKREYLLKEGQRINEMISVLFTTFGLLNLFMALPLNIGILAHADAGKTTLTEQLLFESNAIDKIGYVDKGSSVSDTLSIEKERGISVLSSTISFTYNNRTINLIDTPGHIDFSAEVDRSLKILDLAILVISAVEGIQGQTMRIWESLNEREIPTLIFINKVDRIGADLDQVFESIKTEWDTLPYLWSSHDSDSTILLEQNSVEHLAECNDEFMEMYLDDALPNKEIQYAIAKEAIDKGNLTPIFTGSAKENIGTKALLNYISSVQIKSSTHKDEYALEIFKIQHHTKFGVLYHVKNYGKSVGAKTKIEHDGQTLTVNQLYKQIGHKTEQIKEIEYNDIGFITLSQPMQIGETLGLINNKKVYKPISNTHLKIQVKETDAKDYLKLSEALTILNIEDPSLNFDWDKKEKIFQINIQGEIQIEILKEIIAQRFQIDTEFKDLVIQYKETPTKQAEGFVRYWMPKPCWAILTFLIEPGELNSGVVFKSKVGVNDVSIKYQNEVKRAIPWALEQGLKGWEVTDLKITLIKGEEHQVHSNPGDFLLATPMGVLNGLELAGTDLLEPIYTVQMKFHSDELGAISSELNKMNADIGIPQFFKEHVFINACFPVSLGLKFPISFNSITSGKGRLNMKVDSYRKTNFTENKQKPFKGVHPLDEAQWILHYRGAFKADERKR